MDSGTNLNKNSNNPNLGNTGNSMLVEFDASNNKNREAKEVINPRDFINATPVAKVGHTYPNLYSQASYLLSDVDRLKNEICDKVKEMNFMNGDGNIAILLDAIYNLLCNELYSIEEDQDKVITPENSRHIKNEVYSIVDMSKAVLDILNLSSRLDNMMERIEYTKKHILL